jgi:hypothetical protein
MPPNDRRGNGDQRLLMTAGSGWPSHRQRRLSQQWLKTIGGITVEPTIAEDVWLRNAQRQLAQPPLTIGC